ncbi:hypothetical protein TorRG33x02_279720, partial [Trema orientale]
AGIPRPALNPSGIPRPASIGDFSGAGMKSGVGDGDREGIPWPRLALFTSLPTRARSVDGVR